MLMDTWKYYDIAHKRHLLCNPLSKEKFERFCQILQLSSGAHVLDIACGKGEFLVRLAELYSISGVGVDLSPYCIRDCKEKHRIRARHANLTFIEMDAAKYKPKPSKSFDLTSCIGASWIYKGYKGTLRALKDVTNPGGLIAVGEPFWSRGPSDEYLIAEKMTRKDYGTHKGNIRVGEKEGLSCLYTLVSNHDDWDHYETQQWLAVDEYVRAHPDDTDNPELIERSQQSKETYIRWGRDTLGWAIYLFRNP
jgi:ubiquinone/menaquinone biosynthesis C-methylase UbiE